MPGRSAASRTGGGGSGGRSRRNRSTRKVGYAAVTGPPANAARRKRSVSRTLPYGAVCAMPFQPSTMLGEEAPMPSANRPGAHSASEVVVIASRAGPRV